MTLRVLLVALVAALGLDLPGSEELAAWKRSGREWVAARMADLSSLRIEAEPAPAGSPDRSTCDALAADSTAGAGSGRVDLAFEAAVEEMASGFSADLGSMKSRPPVGVASALVEPRTEPEADPAPSVAGDPIAQDSRLEKISTAVRLTRQAVDAWASLIQPTSDQVVDFGRDDSF